MITKHPFSVLAFAFAIACGGGTASSETTTSAGATDETTSSGGGSSDGSSSSSEFQLSDSDDAEQSHGDHPSEIESTATQAAMRLFVIDPDAGAISGIVIKLTAPNGDAYYTGETDTQGYAEVLVPAGQRYDLEYLSLGRRTTTAHVDVPSGPRQDIRLTLRYRQHRRPPAHRLEVPTATEPAPAPEHLVLEGILFQTGSATLDPESNPRLDRVVEYLTHMASARVRIEGHTDNVGDPGRNRTLSEARARAVRDYLVSHGIDGSRVEAVGLGDAQPIASNDTEEGRAQNRRIEAIEL